MMVRAGCNWATAVCTIANAIASAILLLWLADTYAIVRPDELLFKYFGTWMTNQTHFARSVGHRQYPRALRMRAATTSGGCEASSVIASG
jgi:hypothetical protein